MNENEALAIAVSELFVGPPWVSIRALQFVAARRKETAEVPYDTLRWCRIRSH